MNRALGRAWIPRLGALLVAASLVGCAAHLVPVYDQAVVQGLNDTATGTMTLLAETSNGTDAATFPAREEKYNALIGQLDALAILANARSVPSDTTKGEGGAAAESEAAPPSVHAIRQLSGTLSKMRDTDRKQGLTAVEVQAFRNQVTIYFDQAITYENALER